MYYPDLHYCDKEPEKISLSELQFIFATWFRMFLSRAGYLAPLSLGLG